MTPPADGWAAMTSWLQGLGQPELPKLPGRKHTAPPEAVDRHAQEWEKLHGPVRGSGGAWGWATSKAHHEAGR